MKSYNKLVRDNIPHIVMRDGGQPKTRKLSVPQYKEQLLRKIVEEAEEVSRAKGGAVLIKEISDVEEVLDAIRIALKLDKKEIEHVRTQRKKERGGFAKRIFLESIG